MSEKSTPETLTDGFSRREFLAASAGTAVLMASVPLAKIAHADAISDQPLRIHAENGRIPVISAETKSNIVNEPRIKNRLIAAIRELLEHRALWLYLLCDEAAKKGLAWEDFAPEAIRRCGIYHGSGLVEKGGTRSLKGLEKTLFTRPAQWVFEMKIKESTADRLSIDFHYCPLVKAWQKQNCSDHEIAGLCDIAMWGDRGIAESYGCVMDLPKAIARGDDVCQIRFRRPATGSDPA